MIGAVLRIYQLSQTGRNRMKGRETRVGKMTRQEAFVVVLT